jgi:two-component system sensor kinase FixL
MQRIMPIEGHEAAQGFNLAQKPLAISAVLQAQQSNAPALTIPLQSLNGNTAIGIYVPVFSRHENADALEGFVAGMLIFDVYLKAILPSYLLEEHHFELHINGQKIFSDNEYEPSLDNTWVQYAAFDLHGQSWRVNAQPKTRFLEQVHYKITRVLLLCGVALCLFVSFAAYMALSARDRARVIKDERNKVDHLLKNLPGMAYQTFDEGDWPAILVSEGCEALTGYSKAEFEAHSILWGKIIHPEDYQRVHETVYQAIIHQAPYELEYRVFNKNQDERLVWEKGEAVMSLISEKLILEGFIADITDARQAELEVMRSHAFSDAIVDSVVEAIITIDQNGRIKSFNNAAQIMFGYNFDEVKNLNVSCLMSDMYAQHHDQHLETYLQTNVTHIIGTGRELEAKRKNGEIFPIHLSVNDVLQQDERMFVGLIKDITSQRLAQDQNRKHIEQMAHADRLNSLGEMAAGIAHEVNQPLTAISLFSQSGKNLFESGKFDKLPHIFEKLSLHARRAGSVLERMQMMTQQGDRQKELLDSKTLVNEVLKLAESEARMHEINIKVKHCKTNANVYVDRVQIQQVLLNLLRNAMEATQSAELKHGNTVELLTKVTDEQNIMISVADRGCGLDANMRDKLFTAFSSTKKNGMGIGLSISKSIIEEHGGTIHYAQNTPVGSVFYFVLPVVNE